MRKGLLGIELVVACLISYFVIAYFFSGTVKFEDFALGTETVAYQAVDSQGKLIHIQHIRESERRDFLEGWKGRGSKDVIFFLGNSQTHSINQLKSGDVNFIELLHKKNSGELEVMCHSLPNASLQEFYLSYCYWKNILPLKIVVVPVFMDDTREDGVRGDVFFTDLLTNRFLLIDTTDYLNNKINRELRSSWLTDFSAKTEEPDSPLAETETFQYRSESFLNRALDNHSLVWRNRENVRGEFFTWLYKLRNTVFGINASTTRRMIPQRYDINMEALRMLVRDCISRHIKVLLYIPPIRSDVTLPYEMSAYAKFKRDIKSIADQHPETVFYRDFDKIIPGNLWGYKAATNLRVDREIDFMHFQFKGHQILADSLQQTLNKIK